MATRTRMTVDEYLRIAEEDPRWTELVDGGYVVNHPRHWHARAQTVLAGELYAWEKEAPGRPQVCGPTEVWLTDHDLYAPDAVITTAAPPLTERGMLARLPSICVEIRSPSTWHRDIGRKKSVYEQTGVPELWLIDDVAREILVFRRSSPDSPAFDVSLELTADENLTSPLLPGFGLPLAELFE